MIYLRPHKIYEVLFYCQNDDIKVDCQVFSELVNPCIKIPWAASQVNNITDKMVAKAPTFDIVLKKFIEFIGEDALVGHNIASFDMKFIYRDCEKYYNKTISNNYIDTLKLAKICFPDWKNR